jgi:hypothetical protein
MADESSVRSFLRQMHRVLCKPEPDIETVREWARHLREVDPVALRKAGDALADTIERMPTLAAVKKACRALGASVRPAALPACPDCQAGIRVGFYRLTLDDLDDAGHVQRRVQRHAEVALACTCEAGQPYLVSTSRWDEWQARREAQVVPDSTDAVWVSDRTCRMVPTHIAYPHLAPTGQAVAATFKAPDFDARPARAETPRMPVPERWHGERDWHESERGYADDPDTW